MDSLVRTPSPATESLVNSGMARTPEAIRSGLSSLAGKICAPECFDELVVSATASTAVSPRPQTPTSKRVKVEWHGLPSPYTPIPIAGGPTEPRGDAVTHEDDRSDDEEQAGSSRPTGYEDCDVMPFGSSMTPHYDSLSKSVDLSSGGLSTLSTLAEGDAKLAVQLAASLSARRSARLRDMKKVQEIKEDAKLAQKPVQMANRVTPQVQQALEQQLTVAEATTSRFDNTILPSGELSGVHSTEWQLKYPPGGSTHPSYPWPTADPRLVFHGHFVPLNYGIPSIAHIDVLTLPIGWRHVTWSGLNPIVFDPHQQIFKLTPIGPLPLTSEELQQGCLHDYAPGGKLHPEYGLLPLLTPLSDGSDCNIFNFEGVDWMLPCANMDGPFEVSHLGTSHDSTTGSGEEAYMMTSGDVPPRYVEMRDCPDDVFDLQDGWRWLLNIEQNPQSTFAPTPGRKWRGTGVQRVSRRTKQPIAALMAITMAATQKANVERYLANQNTREFCPLRSVATPVHINISLLEDVEFTIVELLSYFPFHYQWRGAGDRMARAGMSASDISNFINMIRCLPAGSLCSANSVDHYVFRKSEDESMSVALYSSSETINYTAEHWTCAVWEMTDYPLLALTHGLVQLPSESDSGPLTNIIKWVRERGRYQTMLSEVPALLRDVDIKISIDPCDGADLDKEALARHTEHVKIDRMRVLRERKGLDAAKRRKSQAQKRKRE